MRIKSVMCLVTLLVACGDAPDGDSVSDGNPAEVVSEQLTQEQIQQLAERYPRLRAVPLPQPEPSPDADPGTIPEHVRRLANGVARASVTGEASFYANRFEGRRTASGIPFRQNQLVAAHRSYPFGTILRVTNLANDRSVNVRVVDRGPFSSDRRILDLSRRAAQRLDYVNSGRARVRVEVLEWGRGVGAV